MTVTLYELGGLDDLRYSSFSWRSVMALAHKGVEAERRPVRITDKEAIAFSGQKKVPILVDGEKVIPDSWAIAQHLEATRPEGPSLFGGAEGAALARFIAYWVDRQILGLVAPLVMIDLVEMVDAEDAAHLRKGIEAGFGRSLEELSADRERGLKTLARALEPARASLKERPYLCGDAPGYADYCLFSVFQWARVGSHVALVPEDNPLAGWFERLLDAHGGIARAEPSRAEREGRNAG